MSPKSMVQVFGWFGNLLTNSSVAGVQLSPAIFTNIPNPEPNTIRTGPVHFSNTPTGMYSSGIHKVDVALYGKSRLQIHFQADCGEVLVEEVLNIVYQIARKNKIQESPNNEPDMAFGSGPVQVRDQLRTEQWLRVTIPTNGRSRCSPTVLHLPLSIKAVPAQEDIKPTNGVALSLQKIVEQRCGKDSGSSTRGYYGPEWARGPGPPLWTIQVAAMPDNSLTYKGTLFGKWGRYIQQIPPRGTVDENKMMRNKIFRVSGDIDARATW
ncbi:hypothetical protein B0H11DRAFT_1918006 [Mycena galericulata]|nr:hypothetical protein B0H11DRAFT_1918006 [Mycena galericulata]